MFGNIGQPASIRSKAAPYCQHRCSLSLARSLHGVARAARSILLLSPAGDRQLLDLPLQLRFAKDAAQRLGDVVAVVATPSEKRIESATLNGGVEVLERFHLPVRDALESALFVDL